MTRGVVTGARVTHRTADVDELATASPESHRAGVADLLSRPDVAEAFVVSTCNRVEAYAVAPDRAVGRAALESLFADVDDGAVVYADHDGSLRHLLRVAAGLESVVLGEDQIIGQVRTAYEDARAAGGIGPTLETAVTKAIRVGERARTETAINEGVVSLGSAAAELLADDVGEGLETATALVVGAGEMGRLAARTLADRGVPEVIVANRTVPNAEAVVDDLAADARALSLADLERAVSRADAVVAATGSPEPIVEPGQFPDDGRDRVVVDLGQPRDVDTRVGELTGVAVYDLDDLEAITERTRSQRADAAAEVEAIVDHEFDRLREQYKRARADEAIAAMYEGAERIKERELETAFARLEAEGISDREREIVRSMADALVGQLLAPPTESLREAAAEDDWATINTALQLFDPEFGPESPAAFLGAEGESDSGTGVGAIDDD